MKTRAVTFLLTLAVIFLTGGTALFAHGQQEGGQITRARHLTGSAEVISGVKDITQATVAQPTPLDSPRLVGLEEKVMEEEEQSSSKKYRIGGSPLLTLLYVLVLGQFFFYFKESLAFQWRLAFSTPHRHQYVLFEAFRL